MDLTIGIDAGQKRCSDRNMNHRFFWFFTRVWISLQERVEYTIGIHAGHLCAADFNFRLCWFLTRVWFSLQILVELTIGIHADLKSWTN